MYARQAALPDWLFVFQHELESKVFDGRDDLLMLSAVLDELDTVVAGVQRRHGTLARPHWQSLLAELDHTTEALGPGVTEIVAVALTPLNGAIDRNSPPTMSDASALGTKPSACVVIEDTPSGIVAAVAAEMRAIGYAADSDERALRSAGAEIIRSLEQIPELLIAGERPR
jgi:hypothetical protein